jgi:hypothetical protein
VTPFMTAVQDVLSHGVRASSTMAPPKTGASRIQPAALAADTHLGIRAQAEQLVSEANTILREQGETISLMDECGPGILAFTLRYRARTVRVETVITAGRALSRLVVQGESGRESRQLADGDQIQALVLGLLADPQPR